MMPRSRSTMMRMERDVSVGMFGVSVFFFSSRRRHTRFDCDWSSDVCSSDLMGVTVPEKQPEKPWAHTAWNDAIVARVSFTGAPGLRFFIPADQKPRVLELLQDRKSVV